MIGWNRISGKLLVEQIKFNAIWSFFSRFYSTKSKNTTSYKFVFLRSIFENIYNFDENLTIPIDMLFVKFTEIYWNLVVLIGLKQHSTKSSVESELKKIVTRDTIPNISFESLTNTQKNHIIKEITLVGKQYVIGAVYGDFEGSMYSFNKKLGFLTLSKDYFRFIQNHNSVLLKNK